VNEDNIPDPLFTPLSKIVGDDRFDHWVLEVMARCKYEDGTVQTVSPRAKG